MATMRQVCAAALRKVGPVAETSPTMVDFDADVAMELLTGWYEQMVPQGMFGQLNDVITETDYEAKEFERITNNSASVVNITLPATVTDADSGEERVPLDLCPVTVVNPGEEPQNYLYDGVIGSWVDLFGLTLDSEAPLSHRGKDGLACLLAIMLSEERGGTVGAVTAARAGRFLASLSQRNGSKRRSVPYEYY